MNAWFLVTALTVFVGVSGLLKKDVQTPEGWTNRAEDMNICLDQENVTETEVTDFIIDKKFQDDNEPLKKAILCFLKRICFFDGENWNRDVINESEAKNPTMLTLINACIEEDDVNLEPEERAYQAQKCVIERGAIQ